MDPTRIADKDPGSMLGRVRAVAPVIQYGADATGEDPWHLAGLMYRESWCGWHPSYKPQGSWVGWGDDPDGAGPLPPHAFSPFQFDVRWNRAFINSAAAQDPKQQVLYACRQLRNARVWFGTSALHLVGDALEHAVYASYNAGEGAVYHAVVSGIPYGDPDSVTTGKDYSRWIFARAVELQGLDPTLFTRKQP